MTDDRGALSQVAQGARYTLGAVLVASLAFAAWNIRAILITIMLGLLLAAGFDPLVVRMTRTGLRRGAAVAIFLIGVLAFLVGFTSLALTPATQQASELVTALPGYFDELMVRVPAIGEFLDRFDVAAAVEQVAQALPDLLTVGLGILSGIAGAVFGVLTVLALTAYFMLAIPRIEAGAERWLASPERVEVYREAVGKVGGYVTGQTFISITAGLSALIFLTVIDAPYAALLALIVGALDLVPQVGATIGAGVAVLITSFDSGTKALVALGFFVVYQQVENYLIAPRVFARTVDLSPLAAFISALVGGALAGFIGAIFALPVAAMIKTVLSYVLRGRLGDAPAEGLPAPEEAGADPVG